MTTVTFILNKEKKIIAIKIFGHSNYSKKNSDIICSSISSIANFIHILFENIYKIKVITKIQPNIPLLYIEIPDCLDENISIKVQEIFKATKIFFHNISDIYFNYIKVL